MRWEKKGLIWSPNESSQETFKYGILPVPIYLESLNVVRVFFGSTDRNIRSRIYYVDLNPDNLQEVLFQSYKPSLDIGKMGTFDDSGVVPSYILRKNNQLVLYTVGFQRCERVPYMLFAGIAVSNNDGVNFFRLHEAPILPRMPFRPLSQGAPCVIKHDGKYKMWHWFSDKWINVNDKLYLEYKIGYAESEDALNWEMKNVTCIEPNKAEGEFGTARPWVIYEDGIFKMWYSIRFVEKLYRIGYAESVDGINWIRLDKNVGIDISEEGWDSEMICYPSILDVKGVRYLFYNGNNNGATGFGYAKFVDK